MTQFAPTTSPHTYPHMSVGPPLPFLFNIFSESLGSPPGCWICVALCGGLVVGMGWRDRPPLDFWIVGGGGGVGESVLPAPTTILISIFEFRLARSCWVATRISKKSTGAQSQGQMAMGCIDLSIGAEHSCHQWDWTRIARALVAKRMAHVE